MNYTANVLLSFFVHLFNQCFCVKCLSVYIYMYYTEWRKKCLFHEDKFPKTDPNYIRGRTIRHYKGRRCPSCPGLSTNVRRNVLRNHLPWCISPATACWEWTLQHSQSSLLDTHLKEFHNTSAAGRFDSSRQKLWVELVNGLLEPWRSEHKCSSILGLCRFAEEHIKFEKNYELIKTICFGYVSSTNVTIIQSTDPVLQWRRLFICTHYYIGRYCSN